MTVSLTSWTFLGASSRRTTCLVSVGPHQIQSCWPLSSPYYAQCSGVSLFMPHHRRPTHRPLSSMARRYHHPWSLPLVVDPCWSFLLCLYVPHIHLRNSFPYHVALVWVILFDGGFCRHCLDLWRMLCFSLCAFFFPDGYMAVVDLFSSKCFVADISMVFPW